MKTPDDYSISMAYSYQSSDELSDYYDDSADGYDEYAKSVGYVLPRLVAEKAYDFLTDEPIIDIGCGTGILGIEIHSFKNGLLLHGADVSQKMILHAYSKKKLDGSRYYDKLHYTDLTKNNSVPTNYYGLMVSSGTFTTGHLDSNHLSMVIDLMKPKSHAVFSVKSNHFDDAGFQNKLNELNNNRIIKILDICEVDSYDNDGYTALSKIVSLKIN